jgi:hypothetical protein
MQNLHTYLAIMFMDGIGNLLMTSDILVRHQHFRSGVGATLGVGANATGHYKANTAFCTLSKIRRHALMAISYLLKAGVH